MAMDVARAGAARSAQLALYDKLHLETVLEVVLEQLYSQAQWDATVEYGDTTVYTRDVERPFTLYQCALDLPASAAFAARSIVRRPRSTEANAFARSQEVVARLEGPDPSDPDGLGSALVLDNRLVVFGSKINTLILFKCKRLADG